MDEDEVATLVASCNGLARQFYLMHGYQVPEGYRFDRAEHPQERGMWNLASAAYYWIEGTSVDELMTETDDGESTE